MENTLITHGEYINEIHVITSAIMLNMQNNTEHADFNSLLSNSCMLFLTPQ